METPRVLSGSQLVAKGATRKVDGQLPEVGLKEVSPNGSWLEQKQIQSALESRKHLIAVERIEKSGSLSHAIWRDDLKLAEVIKKTGGHWQYIGHNVGKHLYLLPEETLFLIEINCLLLKHNEVTVSIQKAYSLCLSETPIAHYKVYASLSRLGYRVFRHKEPTPEVKTNIQYAADANVPITHITALEEDSEDHAKESIVVKKETNDYVDDQIIDSNPNNVPLVKIETFPAYSDKITLAPFIEADYMKVDAIENCSGSEIVENIIKTGIEKTLQSCEVDPSEESVGISDEIHPIDTSINSKNVVSNHANVNNSVMTEAFKNVDLESNICTYDENVVSNIKKEINNDLTSENLNRETNVTKFKNIVVDESEKMVTSINEGRNSVKTMENNKNIENRIATTNEYMELNNTNSETLGIVYSVDEAGVIRVLTKEIPVAVDSVQMKAVAAAEPDVANGKTNATNNLTLNCNTAETTEPGASTKDSINHFEVEINHYNAKMQRLIERKSNNPVTKNLEGLNSIQDFYQEQVVSVNVPDENYLPRNIFLHKTAYVINVDIIRNQNASNANISSDETDSIDSPRRASRGTDAPRLTEFHRFVSNTPFYQANPRYPAYRPFVRFPPHWNPQLNYNSYYNYNTFRLPMQSYSFHPRYHRYQGPFARQQFRNYNSNMPGSVRHQHPHTQSPTLKSFHYNAIVHIATRFKKGAGRPTQVQALKNLLCTYNARYDEDLELTRTFDIVDKKKQTVREVIVLDDDEPILKKSRLNDDTEKNNHLAKLKELAVKLKELHAKNLAVSRHRRVFSNAIKTFNKWFNADIYLDSNFTIKDRKLIILDSSSDSDVMVSFTEKEKPKKRKKVRNPYNILKHGSKNINVGASTSREISIHQELVLSVNDEDVTNQRRIENSTNTSSPVQGTKSLLNYFDRAWLPSDDDFGRPELCSRKSAQLDSLLFESECLYDILKQSTAEFESWLDLKLTILKEIQGTLDIQKQQAEALSNDFLMETECQIQPILEPKCTDLKTALKQLAIIPNNKEVPTETSLRIHYDVYNRDAHIKKSSLPKPHFRVICCEETAPFPTNDDVVALQAKYDDAVPTVFAFIGISGSVSYLQINAIDLPVYIPDNDLT